MDYSSGFVKHLYNHVDEPDIHPAGLHSEVVIEVLKLGLAHFGKKCGAAQTNFAEVPEILQAFEPWIASFQAHRESFGTLVCRSFCFVPK